MWCTHKNESKLHPVVVNWTSWGAKKVPTAWGNQTHISWGFCQTKSSLCLKGGTTSCCLTEYFLLLKDKSPDFRVTSNGDDSLWLVESILFRLHSLNTAGVRPTVEHCMMESTKISAVEPEISSFFMPNPTLPPDRLGQRCGRFVLVIGNEATSLKQGWGLGLRGHFFLKMCLQKVCSSNLYSSEQTDVCWSKVLFYLLV